MKLASWFDVHFYIHETIRVDCSFVVTMKKETNICTLVIDITLQGDSFSYKTANSINKKSYVFELIEDSKPKIKGTIYITFLP